MRDSRLLAGQVARRHDRRGETSRRRRSGRLLAISENYPQLRANEQFNRLMDELSGTENRIAGSRACRYNEGRASSTNTSAATVPRPT